MQRSVFASTIDHSSDGWQALVASKELSDVGQPSALLFFGLHLILATEVPILVGTYSYGLEALRSITGAVEWIPVPPGDNETVETSVAWARAELGTERRPPDPNRWPLRCEVEDEPLAPRAPAHLRYAFASPVTIRGEILLDPTHPAALRDGLAQWFARLQTALVDPIAKGYEARGGNLLWHRKEQDLPPRTLVLSGGPIKPFKAADRTSLGADWTPMLAGIRSTTIDNLFVGASVTTATGFSQRWGRLHVVGDMRVDPPSGHQPLLRFELSESLAMLAPASAVTEMFRLAAEVVPLKHGTVSVGRTAIAGPWLSLFRETELAPHGGIAAMKDTGAFEVAERISSTVQDVAWLATSRERRDLSDSRTTAGAAALQILANCADT